MENTNQESTTKTQSRKGGVSDCTFDIHECINKICNVIEDKTVTVCKPHTDKSLRYELKKAIDWMLYSH